MHITIAAAESAAALDPAGVFFIIVGGVVWLVYSFAAAKERKDDLDRLSGKTKKEKERSS